MKKMNKLVALLLATVMVLGLMPTMHVHADEHPAIALDTTTAVAITEAGTMAYFTFTPEVTDQYCFYSSNDVGVYADTYGHLYDAEMNELTNNDDAYYGNAMGVSSPNFCIEYQLEAGVTYILGARLYSSGSTGSFYVTLTNVHSYVSEITKEHTCTEDGVLTWTCEHCGASYDEPIPAAHTWGEDGNCTVCGETYLITGVCGDDLTWTLDWFGTMTISGTGDMYDYFYSWDGNTASEWYDAYNRDIKTVVIEEGCTSIGDYAFYQADSMTSVTIPSTVTEIGASAFQNTGLTEIVIPDTVTTLGEGAFASNMSMTKVTLPSGLMTIPASCFHYCYELSEIVWPEALTSIGDKAFNSCNLSDLVVPEGVAYIGAYAFSSNSNMTKLTLPSTLAVLADYAMASCWSVQDFIFTGNVPQIPENTFYYAYSTAWYPAGNSTWTADALQGYGGTITWKAMCAEHAYSGWTTIEATCETGEYQTRTCAACGWVENTEQGEPLGHDYVYNVIEPNCATYEYGRTEVTCTRCDYYTSENWVAPEHTYETSTKEATCTEDGGTVYTCTVCGAYYTDNIVPAYGHTVEEWSEPTEATCTEPGVKTGTCSVCGETVTEEVAPALGHTWDEENPVENDDGSVTYTCTVCGETYRTEGTVLYLGDNEFTVAANSGGTTKTFTATEDGTLTLTLNQMVYHNAWAWDQGYSTEYWQTLGIEWAFSYSMFYVQINGETINHTATGTDADPQVTLDAVEVKAGDEVTITMIHDSEYSYYYDNDVKLNMNLALEIKHDHSYEAVVTDPTCTEAGYTTYTCSCGDTYVADEVPALGHTEEIIPAVEATFDNEGLTEGKICSVCGEILVAQETAPMLDYNDGIIPLEVLEVSCGDWQTGYEATEGPAELAVDDNLDTIWHTNWYGTSREDHWFQFEITEDYLVDGLRYKPRVTGNTNGIITQYDIQVSNDGVNFTSVASGTWEGDRTWKVVKFDSEAVKYVRLVALDALTDNDYVFACAAEIRLTGEKAGEAPHEHSFGEWTVTTEPTCTEAGVETRTCECGETETREVPALGHDFVNGECSRCDAVMDATFEDVPVGSFFFDPVEWAVEKGITTGVDATHFDPNGNCMRAVVVTFLWRAAGEPEPTTDNNPFTDVKEGDFFYKAVLWAVEEGITNGTSATTFDPYKECNRAQVVTFLYRAMGEPEVTSTENPFSDVVVTEFYGPAVLWAVENGITNGMGDGTFGITKPCNRAQVVTFLYRVYND